MTLCASIKLIMTFTAIMKRIMTLIAIIKLINDTQSHYETLTDIQVSVPITY